MKFLIRNYIKIINKKIMKNFIKKYNQLFYLKNENLF